MRCLAIILLTAALALSLAACGNQKAPAPVVETPPAPEAVQQEAAADGGTLVAYFSRVGNTDFPNEIDAVSSATLSRKDGALKGNAQLMAEWMADEAGGDLFEIQTENAYPIDYRETTDIAKREQKANDRPALKTHIEGIDGYSTVYLVFPSWWGDLPMALYSFFDEYDFSGKTIYVSVTHEGSGFSRTVDTVENLEPNATVIEGISLRGSKVPGSEETVRQFVKDRQ